MNSVCTIIHIKIYTFEGNWTFISFSFDFSLFSLELHVCIVAI